MKKKVLGFFAFLFLALFGFYSFNLYKFNQMLNQDFPKPQFSIQSEVAAADIELGNRLYHIRAGCVECHGADLSGVKVIEIPPFGVIHGANITPFGLKDWTDEDIATAIRYGIHKEGRSLRFMPSFDYEGLSLSDVAALVAYIKSVPSIEKALTKNLKRRQLPSLENT